MSGLPDRIVPDSSVVIDGRISAAVSEDDETDVHVFIPEAVVNELEAQANSGVTSGWAGLTELQTLADLNDAGDITVEYMGIAPSPSAIDGAEQGDIDAIIRQVAADHDATLFTSDDVQAETARARGVDVEFVEPVVASDSFAIESFFDEHTMSVHLKSDTIPKAKSGALGEVNYGPIDDEPTSPDQMEEWATEIEEAAHVSPNGFIELSENGMRIIQLRDYRIAIARPPFSDGIEITAVKPIAKTTLDDYRLSDDLADRYLTQRGVLIAGSPGAGKSTYAQAVGEFLNDQGVVVKTMEQPRDLQVGSDITQYTALDGNMELTADSLLLVRPDYTIYDEVRKTDDFDVFADMRLAGVGMIGVVHATRAIDALQRMVGRVELGLIPQIVDTVVYIEDGDVHTVYNVQTEVKIPDGMESEDLARPVIQVEDYETGEPEFELYTFNGQVATVDIDEDGEDAMSSGPSDSSSPDLSADIRHNVKSIPAVTGHVDVEVGNESATVYVEKADISDVIGENGSQISALEDRVGVDLDVRLHRERSQ